MKEFFLFRVIIKPDNIDRDTDPEKVSIRIVLEQWFGTENVRLVFLSKVLWKIFMDPVMQLCLGSMQDILGGYGGGSEVRLKKDPDSPHCPKCLSASFSPESPFS